MVEQAGSPSVRSLRTDSVDAAKTVVVAAFGIARAGALERIEAAGAVSVLADAGDAFVVRKARSPAVEIATVAGRADGRALVPTATEILSARTGTTDRYAAADAKRAAIGTAVRVTGAGQAIDLAGAGALGAGGGGCAAHDTAAAAIVGIKGRVDAADSFAGEELAGLAGTATGIAEARATLGAGIATTLIGRATGGAGAAVEIEGLAVRAVGDAAVAALGRAVRAGADALGGVGAGGASWTAIGSAGE